MTALTHDMIPEVALAHAEAGTPVALATVIETWGAAPRPVGAQLAITAEAEMAGSVSGGCVEGAVVAEALDLLESGHSTVLEFGVADEDAFAVGLTCGGRIRVMVEPVGGSDGLPVDMLRELVVQRAARQAVAYVVDTESWQRRLAEPEDGVVAEVFQTEKSLMQEARFVGLHLPPLRLAIVGAVHIAQPLASMAGLLGYDVIVVDPRDSFGSEARFPGQTLVSDWPDAALAAHGLDARTAVVTLTHDPKLDLPAIETALKSDVFYLGCLGSKKTHAKRVTALKTAGFSEAEIGRIHGPVGLDIGAKSPAEIALSILAEITLRLRRPESRP
ncbi:MAG: XdhC family protein [Rhodobacteraceae bacterium]|nr:XdhC family protein [Paracoccaceae bacterium]